MSEDTCIAMAVALSLALVACGKAIAYLADKHLDVWRKPKRPQRRAKKTRAVAKPKTTRKRRK